MASASGKMMSAEERRRQKELEEARKAGLAAPELDEDGRAINPHIPQFMASAPWYLNNDAPTLKHQRNWKGGAPVDDINAWYDRGAKTFQATKYRKGACENCGSMSHKTKECLERPRSKGARWTGKAIAADEAVQDVRLASFDAKRDRWNGYSSEEWVRHAERFEKVAEVRAEVRRRELAAAAAEGGDAAAAAAAAAAAGDDDDAREDRVEEEEETGIATVEKRVRGSGAATGTVRNLRIREDTAKYLLNLDPESAHYDPKSRSMREDPQPDKDPATKTFAGDNFVRGGGASEGFQALNLFSVTAYERGQDSHLNATPSQAEAAFHAFAAKKAALQGAAKDKLLEKYGAGAGAAPEEVRALRATEAYAEYDAAGRLLRGQEAKAASRYEEDVHPGNHTSVWGSWWADGQWGYACCRQTAKNAYCTGAAGAAAVQDTAAAIARNMQARAAAEAAAEDASSDDSDSDGGGKGGKKGGGRLQGVKPTAAGVWGTEADKEDIQLDEGKLREAVRRAEAAERAAAAEPADDRKRRYNSLHEDCDVSVEDMEAYRLKKSRGEDPLAAIEAAKAAQKGGDGGGGYEFV